MLLYLSREKGSNKQTISAAPQQSTYPAVTTLLLSRHYNGPRPMVVTTIPPVSSRVLRRLELTTETIVLRGNPVIEVLAGNPAIEVRAGDFSYVTITRI